MTDTRTIYGRHGPIEVEASHNGKRIKTLTDGERTNQIYQAFIDAGRVDLAIGARQIFNSSEKRAKTDVLTGALNRYAFTLDSARWLQIAQKYGLSIAFGALDFDRFKQINDGEEGHTDRLGNHYQGHAAGDALLRDGCAIINRSIRPIDQFYRTGGDEITILLGDIKPQDAKNAMERLSDLFEKGTNNTVSIGVATEDCGINPNITLQELIDKADVALYRAKRHKEEKSESVVLWTPNLAA